MPTGKIFFIYLILNGTARFLIEFIRLNPKELFGLTQAQIVAVLFILTGALGWFMVERRPHKAA